MAKRPLAKSSKSQKPDPKATGELTDHALDAVSGGSAHGCPACPHVPGSSFSGGSHILVDGSVFSGGVQVGKIKL